MSGTSFASPLSPKSGEPRPVGVGVRAGGWRTCSSTRSCFLNEMDGFADNDGILTLATSNHPDRIDAAIVERPSRFDRVYRFGLPGPGERRAFAAAITKTRPVTRLGDDELDALAARTDGFSFAYVKELLTSSLVRWMSDRERRFGEVALAEIDVLRSQMGAAGTAPSRP